MDKGFFLSLLDTLFKDADGKLILWRLLSIGVLGIGCFLYVARNEFLELYKNTRYEAYQQVQKQERELKFEKAVVDQLQIAHVSSEAEFSGITEFRPVGLNYFFDLIAYEGKLPEELNSKNLGGWPVDKTSEEYIEHMNGHYYTTTEHFRLPTRNKIENKWLFSCPYYNLNNNYAGSIFMMWPEKPVISEDRLNIICSQASRTIGRTK